MTLVAQQRYYVRPVRKQGLLESQFFFSLNRYLFLAEKPAASH